MITGLLPHGYVEQGHLASGAYGSVHVATQSSTGRSVAVKVLSTELSTDRDRERFESEVALLALLDSHPHVVDLLDHGFLGDGRPFFVMRLARRSMSALMKVGPLSADRVLEIGVGVASALDAAHQLDVFHRDVKPGNILMADDGAPLLADFGIAVALDSLAEATQALTQSYAAPEVFSDGIASAASDQFALGVTLYEALTAEKPFRAASLGRLADQVRFEDPAPLPPEVPPVLATIVFRMLAKAPADRFPSMTDAGAALRHAQRELALPVSRWPEWSPRAAGADEDLEQQQDLDLAEGTIRRPLPAVAFDPPSEPSQAEASAFPPEPAIASSAALINPAFEPVETSAPDRSAQRARRILATAATIVVLIGGGGAYAMSRSGGGNGNAHLLTAGAADATASTQASAAPRNDGKPGSETSRATASANPAAGAGPGSQTSSLPGPAPTGGAGSPAPPSAPGGTAPVPVGPGAVADQAPGSGQVGDQEPAQPSTAPAPVLTPPVITTSDLPGARIGVPYEQTVAATSAGTVTWSVSDGQLPAGLALSATGSISGVPAMDGLSTFTLTASDSNGTSSSSTFTIETSWTVGDLDDNGVLDCTDWNLLVSRYDTAPGYRAGDLNNDGTVNPDDLAILTGNGPPGYAC